MQISFFVDRERRAPEQLLDEWHSLADIATAVAGAGARVTVVQASLLPARITRQGVDYFFMQPAAPGTPLTRTASFAELLQERAPDIFHVHGLGFAGEVARLRAFARGAPILLQDHADRLPQLWQRKAFRRGVAAAAGISFCARAQAQPFQRAGLLPRDVELFEIPESTSSFVPGDGAAARVATQIHGDPAVLWVGHLDRNKDPLTVLAGVSAAVRELPGLRLWCCFGSAPLRSAVEARIANDPALRDRVRLLGRVPHEQIEQLMRAADLFVLGSHREGSSFSLIEALATGLTPVVTDIPSLRALTGNGAVGNLWPCGNARALSQALRAAAAGVGPGTRAAVRSPFDEHVSSAALGRKFVAAYRRLMERRAPASLTGS